MSGIPVSSVPSSDYDRVTFKGVPPGGVFLPKPPGVFSAQETDRFLLGIDADRLVIDDN